MYKFTVAYVTVLKNRLRLYCHSQNVAAELREEFVTKKDSIRSDYRQSRAEITFVASKSMRKSPPGDLASWRVFPNELKKLPPFLYPPEKVAIRKMSSNENDLALTIPLVKFTSKSTLSRSQDFVISKLSVASYFRLFFGKNERPG